jgi:hypothetical protein
MTLQTGVNAMEEKEQGILRECNGDILSRLGRQGPKMASLAK